MDTILIPHFSTIIFSFHHKTFTSLSTVKSYFQKKKFRTLSELMQTKTIQQNALPSLSKQITRNCSLCRGTIYIGLLHIIPVSISVLLNCLGGAGAVTPHWKAACAHWPWCPGSKHSQCPGSDPALQAHGQLQGTVTLTTLQAPAAACCHAPKQPLSTAPRH